LRPVRHFMYITAGCLYESQSGIKLAACQESSVRGDSRATKIQMDSAVELELQRGVGAFTHWVPPARLRYPQPGPAFSASLAHALPVMPMYAAQIGSTLSRLRRTHAADLGNVGLVNLPLLCLSSWALVQNADFLCKAQDEQRPWTGAYRN
jgi:hypothetical protein